MALNLESLRFIYFDIDDTLVNHSQAEKQAIQMILQQFADVFSNVHSDIFAQKFKIINKTLWHKLAHGELTVEQVRTQRFHQMLEFFTSLSQSVISKLARTMGIQYLENYGLFWQLFDGASEAINTASQFAPLGLLSNGFRTQVLGKIQQFGWQNTFRHVVISEDIGIMKPHREIFDHALKITNATAPNEMLYIGDHYESDIIGAARAGWQTVWINLHAEMKADCLADAEITSIAEFNQAILNT
jgi:putative hydrolase of the HAD superfamily